MTNWKSIIDMSNMIAEFHEDAYTSINNCPYNTKGSRFRAIGFREYFTKM